MSMKKHYFFLSLAVAAMMTACSSDEPVIDEPTAPEEPIETPDIEPDEPEWDVFSFYQWNDTEKAILADFSHFSYDMMVKANEMTESDFCCSPVSASIFLSMLANAADGESRDEIMKTLYVDDIEALNALNNRLMNYLSYEGWGTALKISNKFWVSDRYNVTDEFSSVMKNVFKGSVESVDYSNPSTVQSINNWAFESTNGLIPSILPFDWTNYIKTELTAANAVYFKGEWTHPFLPGETCSKIFHGTKGDTYVNMMHQEECLWYSSDEHFRYLEKVNQCGSGCRFEFFLPSEDISVSEMVALLTPERRHALENNAIELRVDLSLPAYQSKNAIALGDIINGMGVNLSEVNLSKMGLPTLPVNIHQKTSLKWDEKGAEAAVLTDGWATNGGDFPEGYTKIEFNRPFIYIIRYSFTDVILMAGVVSNI